VTASSLLINLLVEGVVQGCIYALLAAGFSLLWWVSGIVHLAHGGVTLAGGLIVYLAFEALGLPLPAAVALGCITTVALGLALNATLYSPLLRRGTDEMGLLTASLGALIVMEYILTIAFGPEGATLDSGGLRRPILSAKLPVLDYFSCLILSSTAFTFALLHLLMTRTAAGRRLRAVATNPELAKGIGIRTSTVNQQIAALAAVLSLPAAVFLLFSTGLAPNESLHIVLIAAVTAILGGRGSLSGALIAGIVLGLAESVAAWQLATGWRQLVMFVFLYVIVLVRPQGLFGKPA
jgi:branched-chain amino acid transport system permease protein